MDYFETETLLIGSENTFKLITGHRRGGLLIITGLGWASLRVHKTAVGAHMYRERKELAQAKKWRITLNFNMAIFIINLFQIVLTSGICNHGNHGFSYHWNTLTLSIT